MFKTNKTLHKIVMTLLTLGGLIIIFTKCLEAQDNLKRLVVRVGKGSVQSERLTAYLPAGLCYIYIDLG